MTAKATRSSAKKPRTTKAKAAASKPKKTIAKSVAAKVAPKEAKKSKDPKASLRAWNIRFGVVLLALAVAVVVLSESATVGVTMQYLGKDALASNVAGQDVLATATRHLWDVQLSWLLAKFLAVFGIVFLLAGTLLRARYEAWLDRGVNALRWVGLGLGGGTVVTTVAMLSGTHDASALTLTCGSVVLAALLAASVEFVGAGRRLRQLLAAGALLAVFLPWLIFVRSVAGVVWYDGGVPGYLYFLYGTVTLLIVATVLALYLRIKQRGKWADTFYAERMFMSLSFAAAVLPALQIFAGALQP